MAKIDKQGFYVPEPKDVKAHPDHPDSACFTPDPNVSGRRFEPDGKGGGTLYIRRRRMVPGFRKPQEDWVPIMKLARTT